MFWYLPITANDYLSRTSIILSPRLGLNLDMDWMIFYIDKTKTIGTYLTSSDLRKNLLVIVLWEILKNKNSLKNSDFNKIIQKRNIDTEWLEDWYLVLFLTLIINVPDFHFYILVKWMQLYTPLSDFRQQNAFASLLKVKSTVAPTTFSGKLNFNQKEKVTKLQHEDLQANMS